MNQLRIGVVGGGGIAKAHVIAARALRSYFGSDGHGAEVVVIADVVEEAAQAAAAAYGVERWTTDWRSLIEDDAIDLVTIAVPNDRHEEVAVAAAKAGKHVLCEKPLAHTIESARRMLDEVRSAGVAHSVDLNYRSIPAIRHIKQLLAEGVIGEPISFHGAFLQDWGLDPSIPRSWKFEKSRSGGGPVLSLGCHVIDLAHFLVGEIGEVVASATTLIRSRPLPTGRDTYAAEGAGGEQAPVDIEDSGMFLARFDNGITGSMEFSRITAGRKNHCFVEINGSEGAIQFDYERLNEILLATTATPGRGFTRVSIGPEQDGGLVWTLAGLGVGFAETVVIHMRDLVDAIAEGREPSPNFADGVRAQEVVHAAMTSADTGRWEPVAKVAG